MPPVFEHDFKSNPSGFQGKSTVQTGLFINGKFVDAVGGETIDIINPANEKKIGVVSAAGAKDVDLAVEAAQKAYDTVWGLKTPGTERARLMWRLTDIIEQNADELSALESLDNGKALKFSRLFDIGGCIKIFQYYAGFADKLEGKTMEVSEDHFAYTRHEPIGVVGQIVPWNFPLLMASWKIAPALATGNAIVFKPSEFTALTAHKLAEYIKQAGFPDGVFNIVTGLGSVAGAAISTHMGIGKVAFTGSTAVGRNIMKAAASSNLKKVTLELGGKSPNIILDDANFEEAVDWAAFGITYNHGQCCTAGSRIFVQEGIYEKFVTRLTEVMRNVKLGDPFSEGTFQGPQVSQIQFDRIMNYIETGKKEGATLTLGGKRYGDSGYFIEPTIFTDVKPEMTIVKEEIFGPVVVVTKFKDDEELIKVANDTIYGLAAGVFTTNLKRAITISNQLHAGTVWVNQYNVLAPQVAFGGYKQSGIGREMGEYVLAEYTEVKAVNIRLAAAGAPM